MQPNSPKYRDKSREPSYTVAEPTTLLPFLLCTLKGKSRNKNIILARHISIYLASKLTSYSLSEIGKSMNGKDHTTIMHSVDRIKSLLETDESIKTAVSAIESDLTGF